MTPVPDYSFRQLSYLVAVGAGGSMKSGRGAVPRYRGRGLSRCRDLEGIFGVALLVRRPRHAGMLSIAIRRLTCRSAG